MAMGGVSLDVSASLVEKERGHLHSPGGAGIEENGRAILVKEGGRGGENRSQRGEGGREKER